MKQFKPLICWHLFDIAIVLVLAILPDFALAKRSCIDLLPGQYACEEPQIDMATQQPMNCRQDNAARIFCTVRPGVDCIGLRSDNVTAFERDVPCMHTNGKSFRTALLLSIFFGLLGLDRLYLGYYAFALAKFSTCGGLFIWYFVDVVLIALQQLGPADSSGYVIDYYGPRVQPLLTSNVTLRRPLFDRWL